MGENLSKLFAYLQENNDKNVTSKDVANALQLPISQVDGLFTSGIMRRGLGVATREGSLRYLKLTPAGMEHKE